MRRHGGELVVRALEDEGARFAFGIPGTHNVELYDAMERSDKVIPVLVTDEQSASFMADGVARSTGRPGVVNLVPGAGVTHALSGIAEAFMDGVPLVVLACGIRSDTGRAFQLHDVDQGAILAPVTKAVLRPAKGSELYATVRRAFDLARSGTPGPVAVAVPAELYFLSQEVGDVAPAPPASPRPPAAADVEAAAKLLAGARLPALYLGAGAVGAPVVELAERLALPVTTTISGKGVFPERHPLWLWNGFGPHAPPFVRSVMDRCDALLAIGCRFSEVATGSYGLVPPSQLIHVDVNGDVLGKNFPAALPVVADATAFARALLARAAPRARDAALDAEVAQGHARLREGSSRGGASRVAPRALFAAVQDAATREPIFVADSGNGLFLAMEHLRLDHPRRFLAPVDFSCMGYSVPAAIGAKLANPARDVVAFTGDGALLMTGLELLTAASYAAAPVVCVLRDGELGQIAQFQRATAARAQTSKLPDYDLEALAQAVGATYARLDEDAHASAVLSRALEDARGGRPAVVDVAIDYSEPTFFTRGVVATNFWRLPFGERLRKVARFAGRRLLGAIGR